MSDPFEPQYAVRGRVVPDPLRLYPVPGGMSEPAPVACRHGHQLGPRRSTVGWVSCPIDGVRGGHRTHTCLRCKAMGITDDTIYTPRQDPDCPCKEGTRTFGGASKLHMDPELRAIPTYEPPAKDIRESDDNAEKSAETWRAWLEDDPQK
ncbi:hypothetical protein [Micromonospora sp. NPDC048169]|uniref:hypothetical protein n=1 Tax=Micromonospora sp. NPDC048169 TaxID=3154711 RepID=UPI0033EAB20B